ncbi:helix-turn-helix transcriptional regulator [Agrobacterium rhizogenes]|nr:helix-turn-helix transcriptional regulator [Rhizobium rhizogenes]
MADDIEIGSRLKQARKAAGFKTAKIAAESLGVAYSTYAQHENGTRGITREAELYTRRYKISLDWLMRGKGPGPSGQASSEVAEGPAAPRRSTPNASFPPIYQKFPGDSYVAVRGQTAGGPNGRFILNGAEVGRVFTPPDLEGVEGAYAVRVFGTSMHPRFKPGETVWLNPHLPVRQGDDCVVQMKTDEVDGRESYIKEFVSRSSTVLRLWQHNPDEGEKNEIELDAKDVLAIHKVVFQAML